jgi:hypothetical protein
VPALQGPPRQAGEAAAGSCLPAVIVCSAVQCRQILTFLGRVSVLQFLVRLVSSYRYSGDLVDDELARAEAAELHDAVVARKQLLHGQVVRIVSSRSKQQLQATFERYRQDRGKAFDEVLEERRSDQLAAMLKTAVWCLTSPEKHFAEVTQSFSSVQFSIYQLVHF